MKTLVNIGVVLLFAMSAFAGAPSWWLALHGSYLTRQEIAQVTFPQAPAPAASPVPAAALSPMATPAPATGAGLPASLPVPGPVSCPSAFYAAGASYNPQSTPNIAGWYVVAVPVTKCGKEFQAYSITMDNLTPQGSGKTLAFVSSTTTGLMTPIGPVDGIPTFMGTIYPYFFGTLGASIVPSATGFLPSSTTKLTGSFGGAIAIPIGKTSYRLTPWAQSISGKWIGGLGFGMRF